MDRLEIDKADPFEAGKTAGFRLMGATNGARITGVAVDKDDPRSLILKCSVRPEGDLTVAYAAGNAPWSGPWPSTRPTRTR